jgi:hypothetical protein
MFDDYVRRNSTPLYKKASGDAIRCHLLWGDGVRFDGPAGSGSRRPVRARGGRRGFVTKSALGGASLLEFYFIDVGQGDGVLIKTPNFRHIMIDGGFPRSVQDTGKNAADFVDWKFTRDYGMKRIEIDAMLASHCDADHYGGLADLLDVSQEDELDAAEVRVESFYHAGLSWWKGSPDKTLGPFNDLGGDTYWTRLLDGRRHAKAVTGSGGGPQLHGWWRDFIAKVVAARRRSGRPTGVVRLSDKSRFLPKFRSGANGEPVVRVLGPVEFDDNGGPLLRRFPGRDSQNTNGVSLLLRVDFGRARILLTGDLNRQSQAKLLEDYSGRRIEFLCDVAKACHHGSADVSYKFLEAMKPAATIISSGDNEGHDHPRPSIIAASATTGHMAAGLFDRAQPQHRPWVRRQAGVAGQCRQRHRYAGQGRAETRHAASDQDPARTGSAGQRHGCGGADLRPDQCAHRWQENSLCHSGRVQQQVAHQVFPLTVLSSQRPGGGSITDAGLRNWRATRASAGGG